MISRKVLIAATALASLSWTNANAFERGFPGWQQKPGVTLGASSAGAPPPGIYASITGVTYQAEVVGPSAVNPPFTLAGLPTKVAVSTASTVVVFVPGWEIFGAQYSAVIGQQFVQSTIQLPTGTNLFNASDLHNTFILPVELSWKLGDSGFFVKTGLGMYVPNGAISGPSGLNSIGSPWWTFQPELIVSYLKNGWNFTANTFMEINTKNTVTGYTTGNLLHAEFTATKTIGAWTFGPVAYYAAQVTDDKSSAFYGNLVNVNRYDIWAAGAKVGYNFGPATLNVWGLREIHNTACGATCATGTIPEGWTAYAQLAFRLWEPEPPVSKGPPLIRK